MSSSRRRPSPAHFILPADLWPVTVDPGEFELALLNIAVNAEFIRRFLLHVLPSGFHRIRHYGLFAGTVRAPNIERVRQWLAAPEASPAETDCDFEDRDKGPSPGRRCPCFGGRMIIVETFDGARPARSPSPTRFRIDTS
jgi:putative transposase